MTCMILTGVNLLIDYNSVVSEFSCTGAPSRTQSSQNSLNIVLDMGRGRSGLGRPDCGGAAKALYTSLPKSILTIKGSISLER